jgi:hypothetical protein
MTPTGGKRLRVGAKRRENSSWEMRKIEEERL